MKDNMEDLTTAYMLGRYDGRKEAQAANSRCSDAAGSVIIHRVERERQVFDENGEHWLDSFQIEIKVGVQSFDLAYEADTDEAAEWYANQVVNALKKAGMRVSLQNDKCRQAEPTSNEQH